jgi:hypothetical protein
MLIQGQVGQTAALDGTQTNLRQGRTGEIILSQAHGRYYEQTSRGQMFTLTLSATTSGIAAGNLLNAAAAASTNFAIWNPIGSGFNLSITKVMVGLISGTLATGPLYHAVIQTSNPTINTVSTNGVAYNNLVGGKSPVARYVAVAAGTALTGASAPVVLRTMNLTFSAAAFSAPAGANTLADLPDGDLIIPPGYGWVPQFSAAGTSVLNSYSVTWEEIPI